MKDAFIEILSEPLTLKPHLLRREKQLTWVLDKVQVIIGPRRSGKSSLLQKEIGRLMSQGVSRENIVYVNFEDDRIDWAQCKPDELLQAWYQLYPQADTAKAYFMFDEVQNASNWEKFVRRLHDRPGSHVAITGSNSKMLATEVASTLRGRGYPIEVLPLSFNEFLRFRNIPAKLTGQQKFQVINAFSTYLQAGGFPEITTLQEPFSRSLLQEYYNAMLFRDIIDRYGISQHGVLKYMLGRIAGNIGKPLSLRKIFNELKTQGYKLSNTFLYELADQAEAGYFFKRISKFDYSVVKRELSDKKAYFIDNGLINAITIALSGNYGAMLENAVFWQLYRVYGNLYSTDIFYYKDTSSECDFVIYTEGGKPLPVQVCYTLSDPDTEKREIKGLLNACKACKSKTGWVITFDEERELTIDGVTIQIKPAWKWMTYNKPEKW